MKIIDYIEDNIPDYALSYLINGDASGISDEDKENCDEWLKGCTDKLARDYPGLTTDLVLNDDEEGSFYWNPAFGKACNCISGAVVVWAENDYPMEDIPLPWEEESKEK